MGITRIAINGHFMFQDGFTAGFCRGINVLIGGNATGKTTLLREMYGVSSSIGTKIPSATWQHETKISHAPKAAQYLFIPEKDILEHARGLLTFIEDKHTGFSEIYRKVLVKATDAVDKMQSTMQKSVGEKISDVIGGHVEWVQGEGTFYMIKKNGNRIPFALEASGYKRLGYLGLLVACGQIKEGSVLFWDEPENRLNPEMLPKLAEILLELARGGVQIFIATHSEILASYLAVCRQAGGEVLFHSLYKDKDGKQIKVNSSDRFDLLEPNNLTAEPVRLYEMEIVKGLGGNV